MRIMLWHVHGSWTTAFVQGSHQYLVPRLPGKGPDGLGRADTWDWPPSVTEISPQQAAAEHVDLILLQRERELDGLAQQWLGGRRPGVDLPAVYVEHNAPEGPVNAMRHPAADRPGIHVVHVTHFNKLFWDTGSSPATVIEHGVVDPGPLYTGERQRAVAAINDAPSRGRVTGTDLLVDMMAKVPTDLFGMRSEQLGGRDVPQSRLHAEMARRRTYFHPVRWTSLGLSLIEAMTIGMPVVAVGTTEVHEAVPPQAGVVSTRPDVLESALWAYLNDADQAVEVGKAARTVALGRFGLGRFLDDWDDLFKRVTG
ncbi:MAG: glycosyltransferase [Actinomycetota bacterium]|nr:glycosyltransferase [Actinomycetota bacterium]